MWSGNLDCIKSSCRGLQMKYAAVGIDSSAVVSGHTRPNYCHLMEGHLMEGRLVEGHLLEDRLACVHILVDHNPWMDQGFLSQGFLHKDHLLMMVVADGSCYCHHSCYCHAKAVAAAVLHIGHWKHLV